MLALMHTLQHAENGKICTQKVSEKNNVIINNYTYSIIWQFTECNHICIICIQYWQPGFQIYGYP